MGLARRSPMEARIFPSFNDEGVGAQDRISRYLKGSVVDARLRTCWSHVGEGVIAMDLTYLKSGSSWAFEDVKVEGPTLLRGQDAAARLCMEESARATTFPVGEGVQLTDDQIARMIGSGGVITVPGCSECVRREEYPYGL